MPATPHVDFESVRDDLHHVRVGPVDWLTVKQQLATHRDWIADEKSATEGKYTIVQTSDYDGNRYLNYYFEHQVSAFNFKIRWG